MRNRILFLFLCGLLCAETAAWAVDYSCSVNGTCAAPIPIPDDGCPTWTTATITVPDHVFIGSMTVPIVLPHTWRGDLAVELESPAETVVRLADFTCGSADNITGTYQDGAGYNCAAATWAPDGPGVLADYFAEDAFGTWTIRVCDGAGADTGSLNDLTLSITELPDGIFFDEEEMADGGGWGDEVTYSVGIFNNSGSKATITLEYSGNTWDVDGPASIDVADGASASFDVTVTIPADAAPGATDAVTVEATLGEFSDTVTLTTTADITWFPLASAAVARQDPAAVVLDDKLYFIGGSDDFGDPVGAIGIYDIVGGSWSTGASMSPAITIIAAAGMEGKIYVPGGFDGVGSMTTTNYIYDVEANTWSTGAAALNAYGAYAVVTDGTYIYRIGGANIATFPAGNADFDRYDPVTDTWEELPSMPTGRTWAFAAHIDGKIYVAGGFDSAIQPLATMDVYDIATETWNPTKALANLPFPWWGGGSGAFCGLFFVFGGIVDDGATGDCYYYNPETDTWTEWARLTDPRFRLAGAGSDDYGLFAVGGMNPAWTPHETLETWDICPLGDDDDDDTGDDDTGDDDTGDDDTGDDDTGDDDTDDDDTGDDDIDDDTDDDTGDDDDDDDDDDDGCGC